MVRAIIAETSNYNGATVTNTFAVSKAVPVYTAPTATSPTYNGNAQALLNAGSTSDGTIQYSADGVEWNASVPQNTNAGTYTSYWRLIGDADHADIEATAISTTIAKATGNATVSGVSLSYNGSARDLVIVSGNTGTMYYRVGTGGA